MEKKFVVILTLVIIVAAIFYSFLLKENFEIIHYDKNLNYSATSVFELSFTPSFTESYWIRYNNKTVIYVTRYVFNSSNASSIFSKEMLNLFKEQIKTMENYSFENYNGSYIFDGKKSSFYLVKDNVFLTFNGEDKEITEVVVKWFIGKHG